ncbi:hypothetical protein PAHAL_5G100200 [Panicum hallii]|uniref:Uncharacterized protein n=1 Tax=Panicum hallii TaxID=206008 RepID=A0A2T8IJJ4_9POAL|nr:hypothetical protein PAHAL_5G100200 [Panicum hallii]
MLVKVSFWFCQILTIQFFQAADIQGYQNQYGPKAQVAPVLQNQYVNNIAGIPTLHNQYASSAFQHSSANCNQLPLSNQADQQKALHLHVSSSNVSSVNRVSENSQAPCQDSGTSNVHMVNKVQIPINPRIAPSLPIGMPKMDESNLEANSSLKPAYVCVSMPKNDVKAAQEGSEAVMQGSFPVSLRTYVERNLAHCKDDAQRTASRRILKEIITKATADGTLHTKNWDIEPLLNLPEITAGANMTSTGTDLSPFSFSSSRSRPSRRTKSRWEPVAEEKVTNNVEVPKESAKSNICSSLEPTKRTSNSWDLRKFVQSRQVPFSQCSQSTTKKQRTGGGASLTENGNASSDSSKEQDLMKYYSSSITLANSPEEKKRREHRSKRFERSQDVPSKSGSSLPDNDATANIYTGLWCLIMRCLLSRVYETHARLAIQSGDLPEYSQEDSEAVTLNSQLTTCYVSCCTLIAKEICFHRWQACQRKPRKTLLSSMPLKFLLSRLATMFCFSNYTRWHPT